MPKVDPETHEPMSDDPAGPEDQRGGQKVGSLGGLPDDANPTGSDAPIKQDGR